MLYIVFNGMPSKYKSDYKKCKINLLKLAPSVVFKCEISFMEKIKIFIKTLFPRLTILNSIKKQNFCYRKIILNRILPFKIRIYKYIL